MYKWYFLSDAPKSSFEQFQTHFVSLRTIYKCQLVEFSQTNTFAKILLQIWFFYDAGVLILFQTEEVKDPSRDP